MPFLSPDDDRLRRARETADRLRGEADLERRLARGERSGGPPSGAEAPVPAGTAVRGRVVGGDLAGPLAALEAAGWRLLHDVRRRASPLARLDHVAVGPQGLVVVQQVVFEGVVTVEDGALRLNSSSYAFETREVATAAAGLLVGPAGFRGRRDDPDGVAGVPLRTVLCVVPAEPPPAVVRPGVHVVGRAGLGPLVADAPAVLDPDAVARVHAALARALRAGDGLRRPRHPLPG
ncbi:hypothetical protein [Kineosporia sp. R_H_3]|uniref:hypothetical protein n=1 Tax=Kineosporia sp. R_H_3 TaxID=1961848 RepID=UPI000B4BF7E1|nr:hypothetical protein [Kineosporia sp. R_H_3]